MPWLGWKAGRFVIEALCRRITEIEDNTASDDTATWGDDDPNDAALLHMVIEDIRAELDRRPAPADAPALLAVAPGERTDLVRAIDALIASEGDPTRRLSELRARILAERGQPTPAPG